MNRIEIIKKELLDLRSQIQHESSFYINEDTGKELVGKVQALLERVDREIKVREEDK